MSSNRSAAVAILAGTLAGLLTMALHPTGADVLSDARHGVANLLAPAVHWLAILAQPLVLAGMLALTMRLRERRELAVAAFVFFALASAAVIVAAAMSGLVFPAVLRGLPTADAAARAAMARDLHYTGLVNQAFAAIYAVFTGIAIVLWSWAMRATPGMSRGLAGYGLVFGVLVSAAVLAGHLRLDIHGFGAVVLGIGIWMAWAAAHLWRGDPDGA